MKDSMWTGSLAVDKHPVVSMCVQLFSLVTKQNIGTRVLLWNKI